MRKMDDGRFPFMRATQFCILIACSVLVTLCMIEEIFLSRAIIRQNYAVVDAHERSSTDGYYKNEWEKLALSTYRASQKDPAMTELLKEEGVAVHEGPPPGTPPVAPSPGGTVSPPAPGSKPVQAPAARPATP